uniref:Laminin G domain-containing protein n=1 Tax=Meloidogyne enterolobii TaxID=390850 RepID=A0A6V7WJJ3_MELEN|nr:unnamed protein product [Meloidogyne enterolobii]
MRQPLLSDDTSSFCCCSSSSSSKSDSFIKTTKIFSSNKKQFSNFNSPKITSKNYFAIKNFNFLILFKFYNLLTFLSIFCCVSSFSLSPSSNNLLTTTQPRPSCREHLLNGNSENKIFPLLSPSNQIYWLECRFPPPGPQSGRLSYQTIINNALTGRWINLDEIKKETNNQPIYVQQQITNYNFLSKLIVNSDECLQLINIKWLEGEKEENNLLNETESIILETFSKEKFKFNRNNSTNINEVNTFSIRSGPVIKINSPFPSKTAINLGPLICRQMLIPRPECQFELRSDKDRIRLKLFNLRKKATKSTASTLSISFRTSKPNGRLLELLDGGNGPLGALDLVDGYLLFSNHIVHPSKLLADGLWHTIHLHLHSLSVRIDNLWTSLSLRETSDFGEPKWIDILVHGEVAALRILDNNGDDGGEEQWICNDLTNNDLLEVRQSLPQQHIFSQPAACAPSNLEQNFCNCKGPNSALIQNGGFSLSNSQIAKCSLLPNDENSSVHLSRYSDRLSFLLIPMQNNNFGLKTTISVLFKSEKESGLILFGVFSPPISPTNGQQKVLLNGGGSLGRIQVHFIDNKVFASQCLLLADGSEKCYSCFVKLNKAFGSHDQWTRISLFHQLGNNFMSVDDLVCLLSPNSAVVDSSELYRITAKNFLFVGGTFYAKNILLNKIVSERFKKDFQDNTKEKAPSLEGCIAEILINGNKLNIPQLINEQKERAAINKENLNNIFSIKLGNCGNCPIECEGAPCSRHSDLPICQCSKIFSPSDKEIGGNCLINKTTEQFKNKYLIEIPSSQTSNSIKIPIQTPSLIANNGRPRIAKLNKIWILFKLPENKLNKELFLKIGSLYLNIDNYEHKVLLESKEYGIFEEFLIEQAIDSRLHLFSIERKLNNFGANNDGNLLVLIRFDNQIKYLQLEELPIFVLSPTSIETFEIEVFQNKEGNGDLIGILMGVLKI